MKTGAKIYAKVQVFVQAGSRLAIRIRLIWGQNDQYNVKSVFKKALRRVAIVVCVSNRSRECPLSI